MFYYPGLWIRKPIFIFMNEVGVIVDIKIFTACRNQIKT